MTWSLLDPGERLPPVSLRGGGWSWVWIWAVLVATDALASLCMHAEYAGPCPTSSASSSSRCERRRRQTTSRRHQQLLVACTQRVSSPEAAGNSTPMAIEHHSHLSDVCSLSRPHAERVAFFSPRLLVLSEASDGSEAGGNGWSLASGGSHLATITNPRSPTNNMLWLPTETAEGKHNCGRDGT